MRYDHERVKAFKNELRCYNQLKRDYTRLSDDLKVVTNKLFGYGGPNYDGMPRIQPNPLAIDPRTALFERKRKIDEELALTYGRISNIETVLNLIDDDYRDSVIDVYVKERSVALVSSYKNLSERSLKYWINREIFHALIERDNLINGNIN